MNMRRFITRIIPVVTLALLPRLCDAAGGDVPAEQLLNKWGESSGWDSVAAIKVVNDFVPHTPGRQGMHSEYVWYRDHALMEARGTNNEIIDPTTGETGTDHFVDILMGDQFVQVGDGGARTMYHNGWRGFINTKIFPGVRHDWDESPEHGNVLDGRCRVDGSVFFPQAMLKNKPHLRDNPETINGVPCRVVEATTPEGQLAAWISPDNGYVAMKYTHVRGPHDLFAGKGMASWGIDGWSLSVEVSTVAKVDRWYIPTMGTYRREIDSIGKKPSYTNLAIHRSDINLAPDFKATNTSFGFKDIPNGTAIRSDVPGSPRLKVENGELVPVEK